MLRNTAAADTSSKRLDVAAFFKRYGCFIVLAVVLLINILLTPNFVDIGTFRNIVIQSTPIILISMGMTMVIATGGIDISVGSVMAISSMVAAQNLEMGLVPAVIMAVLFGGLCGLWNGFIIAKFKIQPIIVTLMMMITGRGIAQVLNDARILFVTDAQFNALGTRSLIGDVPIQTIYIIAAFGLVLFLIKLTAFGRYVQAMGDNPSAARLAGVNTFWTILMVYMITSMLAGFAGVIETARMSAAEGNTIGRLMELDAIAAVAVGGTALSGGKARVAGTLVGALIMQLITISVIMNNIPFEFSQIIKAIIIIIAVYLQREKSA